MNGEGMNLGGWLMLAIGCLILYGGLAVCLFKAAGSRVYTDKDYDENTNDESPDSDLMTSGGDG